MKPFMIALAGGSGAGKTTIVSLIRDFCPSLGLQVIEQDHYYADLSHLTIEERAKQNFDHPLSLDTEKLEKDLEALSQGRTILRPTYCFKTHTRTSEYVEVKPTPVIIFDGIFALHSLLPQKYFDLKLFVDVDDDVRFIRRLLRDRKERGRSTEEIVDRYNKNVRPMHVEHVAPFKKRADFVIDWNTERQDTIKFIASIVSSQLNQRSSEFRRSYSNPINSPSLTTFKEQVRI